MKKKAGIVLSITGAIFIITAIIMLLTTPARQNKDIKDKKDITEITQEIKNEEKQNITTEQSAHSINPEVYEWPCGSKHFQNWEEPKQVIEFAKYKEYYEQIAQQFLEYEGKNVDFYATDDMIYFDETEYMNEGSVKVSYDKELMMNLFEKSKICAIRVYGDYIIFYKDVSDRDRIMYLYDETLTYNDPFPSEKDDLISGYWMVNIAPHWWWEELGDEPL